MNNKKIKFAEVALISFVWIVLLAIPILFREDSDQPIWRSINSQLEILVPVSLLFLLNRYVFVPLFLFRRKLILYIVAVSGVIFLSSLGSYYYDIRNNPVTPREQQEGDPGNRPPRTSAGEDRGPEKPQRPVNRQPRPVPPLCQYHCPVGSGCRI